MSIRSLKHKAKARRKLQRLRARNGASDNNSRHEYQNTGEEKGKAVARRRAPEEGQRTEGGDNLVREVDKRVEDNPGGTEEKNRKKEWEDDWIWKIDVEEGQGKVEGGVVLFMIYGEWRQVAHHLWAWNPLVQVRSYKKCMSSICLSPFDCSDSHRSAYPRKLDYCVWIPQLVCSLDKIRDSLKSMSPRTLSSPRNSRRDMNMLGAQIPPELFPLLYGWMGEMFARKCRLVCRYWDEQCRERAFTRIDVQGSEKRVLELVRFKYDPAWRHIPPCVEQIGWVPSYDNKSTRPWLHLLDPRWRGDAFATVSLQGPFPGRRTIRSIHFALPRSVPPSFSRGTRSLHLTQINFCRFEDAACLVSELPDLETLSLRKVTWKSLPSQLPRRRPRVNRNKLGTILVEQCKVEGVESPSFLFPAFTLFPNVYSAASFFSPDIVTGVEATLDLVSSRCWVFFILSNPRDGTDAILDYFYFDGQFVRMLSFKSPKHDPTDNNGISVFIDLDHHHIHVVDNNSDKWAELDTAISSLQRQTQFLFGCRDRARMLRFAADVVSRKLPSLSTRGEVQYTMAKTEERQGYRNLYWYQASLESEELQGKGTKDPWKVYT